MNIFRRVVLGLGKVVFEIELVIWLALTSLVLIVGAAAPIKQALHNANVYDRVVDVVLKQSAAASGQGGVPLDDQTIKNVVKSVFSGKQLETYTDNFLDGTYAWLEGKSATPNFRIDLTPARQTIADGVANRAAERLASLPVCTQIPTGTLDPFSITCLPPGIDIQREKQRITNEMLTNADFLPSTVLTAEQLPRDASGKTFAESHSNFPKLFGLAKVVPWLVAIIGGITAAALILLRTDKRRGIRTVGRMVLANGSFVLVTTLIFGLLLPKISDGLQAHFVGGEAAPLMNDILKAFIQLANRALIITSGTLVALGGAILLAERFIKPTEKVEAPVAEEKPAEPATEKTEKPAQENEPKEK